MNIKLTTRGDPVEVEARRARNDRFRRTLTGGSLMVSAGIMLEACLRHDTLGAANQARIIAAVRGFTGFDDDFEIGDPVMAEPCCTWTDDHSIGDLEVEVEEPGIHRWPELIFFRVDDLAHPATGAGASPAPASGTALVLTLMLASEW